MIYDILKYPDKRLFTVAEPVTVFDDELREIIMDMYETMEAYEGVGLAATQVNIHKQIIVVKIDKKILTIINPTILTKSGTQHEKEGCLSFPGISTKRDRYKTITLQAQDEFGDTYVVELDELWSICVQHECDHLKGRVFIDDFSDFKKKLFLQRYAKKK